MAEAADSHDLDKLTRWHDGLTSETGRNFPVCALFLASGEDTRAHDIFRIYRTAFEDLGGGFHDLVIFGQHGVSSTSTALVPGLGLAGLRIPALVLITREGPPSCYSAHLPSVALADGESEDQGETVSWKKALEIIVAAVGEGSSPSLDGVSGLEHRDFPGVSLAKTVGSVKKQVEEPR
jgi:hypothetical protein